MSIMSELDIERQEQGYTIPQFYAEHGWSLPPEVQAEELLALEDEANE